MTKYSSRPSFWLASSNSTLSTCAASEEGEVLPCRSHANEGVNAAAEQGCMVTDATRTSCWKLSSSTHKTLSCATGQTAVESRSSR